MSVSPSITGTKLPPGAKVTWTTASGVQGSGTVYDKEDGGHVMVIKDAPAGEERPVIYCAVSWLTAAKGTTLIP